MNPFVWRREHQIAIILGVILGVVILVVIGFMRRGHDYGMLTSDLVWSASTARWAIPALA
jgi:Mg/Co/Ni transporter MgtE